MAKFVEKIRARKLRKNGQSIKEIAKLLKVSVASVSNWCRDIKLTSEQIKILELHSKDPNYGRRLTYSLQQRMKRIEKTEKLFKEGEREIGILNKRELFLAGVALYWAEGFKKDNQAGFSNMDPLMIKFFIKWLRECFNYSEDHLIFRVTANISYKDRIDDIHKYWSEVTGAQISKFQKPFFQKFTWKKVYENPDNYKGILRIKVRKSTDFLRKIYGWIEGLRMQAH